MKKMTLIAAFLAAVLLFPWALAAGEGGPVTVRYATGFSVESRPGGTLVTVHHPWRNASTAFSYLLYPRGENPPKTEGRMLAVAVPVDKVVLTATTMVPYFVKLGVDERITGLANAELVTTKKVADRVADGTITTLGAADNAGTLDMERLYKLAPDLVMAYGVGDPRFDMHGRLFNAGFPVAMNADYMETTPLGRAEWIKFVALFFGKEKEAARIFDQTAKNYQALAQKTRAVEKRPTVFLNMDFLGTWYVPGGKNYMASILNDAGARYLWADDQSSGSIPLSVEAVAARASRADFWLHPGTCRTLSGLLAADSRYRIFAAFRNDRVYNNDGRMNATGGNDFWENGVADPDLLLKDLVHIFHPELVPGHKLVWYRKLTDDLPK